ncbi:MAG TPA: hypothetical protein VN648_10480 [Candidatus Methylomirabilis sp.]|nr:hypothetical protein [Candidatus Methylomirabilis sp.]
MSIDSQAHNNEPEEPDLPERWSAKRKTEVVLRLLRGEPLKEVFGRRRRLTKWSREVR